MMQVFILLPKAEARRLGLRFFFTGRTCKNGHVNLRYTSKPVCLDCAAAQRTKPHYISYKKNYRQSEKSKASAAARKKRDVEKIRIQDRKRYVRTAESQIAKVAAWKKNNPEKYRQILKTCRHNRRARKKNCGGSHTAADRTAILQAQRSRCGYCKCKLIKANTDWDHIIPLALGGSNDRSNMQALCKACNRSKGAVDPVVFAKKLGLLI